MAAKIIWVLLGPRRGDNQQVLTLADALGMPYVVKKLESNILKKLPNRWLLTGRASLRPASRALIAEPWPDLIITIGQRFISVADWVRTQSGGRTKIVVLGRSRANANLFDLVIVTPQYPLPDAINVLKLPLPIIPVPPKVEVGDARHSPKPVRLLIVGGDSSPWRVDAADLSPAVELLQAQAKHEGGSLIVITSPRTTAAVKKAIPPALLTSLSYHEALSVADQIFVTADSVSMLTEAILTGKPVGMVPVRRHWRKYLINQVAGWLKPKHIRRERNLPAFWRAVQEQGWAGTIAAPSPGQALHWDALGINDAIARVKQLLA